MRSATRSSVSSSFMRRATGLSSMTLAVLSSERVAAVSSRRRITLAWACFSACTTWVRMAFISPGSTMSFTPTLSTTMPKGCSLAAMCAVTTSSITVLFSSSSSSVRVPTAARSANCSSRYRCSAGFCSWAKARRTSVWR